MTFSSSRKRMGLITMYKGKKVLVEKGASELILESCTHYHSYEHGVVPIENYKQLINDAIGKLANTALRTICLAYKEVKDISEVGVQDKKGVYDIEKTWFILICILGIKDILR